MSKDIELIESVVAHIEHKMIKGLAPDDLVLKLGDRLVELTQPQLIKDAPKDGEIIRLFTENTSYGLAKWLEDDGYTGNDGDWWEVNEYGNPMFLVEGTPTHFLPIPKVSVEDLKKIYV